MKKAQPRLAARAAGVLICTLAGAGLPAGLSAQSIQSNPTDSLSRDAHSTLPNVTASRLNSAIKLDGRLDEAAWNDATPASEFTQTEPQEGQPASERTEARFLYDDEALYIGVRMWDSKGDVRRRLGRRDSFVDGSDWLYIMIDSHHDHLTAYQFSINPAGVKRDELANNTGRPDDSWDAVWDAATETDGEGWVVELRIPFSQLRFPDAAEQTWGVQVSRRTVRNQEVSVFSFTPKSERGGVARYGHLRGLQNLRTGKRMEALPYTVARADFANVDPANPFGREAERAIGAGLDLKYRLTSSLTLDGTINPDFGQVEQDPAVVNLSAFETSFMERRPFFVEGSDIFRFGDTGGGGGNQARLFYSRRIGRTPQGTMPSGTQYSDRPDVSTILAAAKLSGRTASGWNLGFLQAVSDREHAAFVRSDGTGGRALVEPLTNFLVGRAQRNLRSGQSNVGLIATAVHRKLETSALEDLLRSSAYVGGLDFSHEFFNRSWSATGQLAVSHVQGSEAALLRTQLASSRYFQRPDAHYVDVDSSLTSLNGYAARFEVGKRAGLHWRGEINMSATSPLYEVNDAGFQTSVDRVNVGGNLTYVQNRPGKTFRDFRISANPNGEWNYGREFQGGRVNVDLNGQLLSYWGGNINFTRSVPGYDDRLTRGGPSARDPGGYNVGWEFHSDNRRRVTLRSRGNYSWNESGGWHRQVGGNVTLRPAESWSISLGPSLNSSRSSAQYLGSVTDTFALATFGHRYLFSSIRQKTLSMETRLSVNFAPEISLDLFAQPFVSSGDYGAPMQLRRPRAYEFDRYGQDVGTIVANEDGYTVDADGAGPASSFFVRDRDFNTRSLRGNAVLRWEWRPGSTLFLVWQQRRSDQAEIGTFRFNRELSGMFAAKPENVFLMKLSYWFNP